MAITSVGYSGTVGWLDWARITKAFGVDYGVDGPTDLAVSIEGATAGTVKVAPGIAFGAGIVDTVGEEVLAGLTAPNTWYTIVVRRDWTGGVGAEASTLEVLQGGSSRAVAAGRQVGPGATDEQPIALVHRGTSSLDQVVDLRCWSGNGALRAATQDALAYLGRPGSVVWIGEQPWVWAPDTGWSQLVLPVDAIPPLPASKITSGALHVDRIPSLPASKITSGALHLDRIPALPASKITSGALHVDRIPSLSASKITSGVLSPGVGGTGATNAAGARANLGLATMSQGTAGSTLAQRQSNGSLVAARFICGVGRGNGILFGSGGAGAISQTNSDGLIFNATPGAPDIFFSSAGRIGAIGIYNTTTGQAANLYITANGYFSRSTSSRRYKTNIEDARVLEELLDIQPRTWTPRTEDDEDIDQGRGYGAIAEELHDLGLTELVTYDQQGRPEAISYERIAVALIPHVRAQRDRIDDLETRLAALETRLSTPEPAKRRSTKKGA